MAERTPRRRLVVARPAAAAALVLALAVGTVACGSDDDDTGAAAGAAVAGSGPTSSSATAEELAAVDLTPALLRPSDFPEPDAVEPILLAGDFGAVGPGQRIKPCGQDLRVELGAEAGRFSQFRVDRYAVTHTVSALPEPQASALGQRFAALTRTCTEPWVQPDPNGGQITRRVLGGFPIPDLGTDAAAFLVRAENQLGEDDTVLLMAIDGPYVATLAVTGPVGDRFGAVRPLELALAERLRSLPPPGGAS
ncbi:MAG: hypothetical protein KDB35_00825 [Acidimicrobiales bacterium]|nr:hypothetical protein [Acidimicrobiales bacterium]MCB1016268.1 hypothetical protein [Acidimicrobiales bacterium]MCB9371981.1 hypothetical protein [Microthrixaceae bacterium]